MLGVSLSTAIVVCAPEFPGAGELPVLVTPVVNSVVLAAST